MNNQSMQTLVVHMDQLTPENMIQLAQAGYTIMRDSNLLIFARPIPPQDQPSVSSPDGIDENVPTQLPTNRNA